MQKNSKIPSSAGDFLQLAQLALEQARVNLESARVLTEMGQRFLENASALSGKRVSSNLKRQ
jgi:hypothetical protein